VVVPGRFGAKAHPAIAAELAARSFVAKMLQKLGITLEPVKPIGRPPGGGLGISKPGKE
jgi:hypothetical protein